MARLLRMGSRHLGGGRDGARPSRMESRHLGGGRPPMERRPTVHCAVRTHGALATVDLRHGSQKSNFLDANAESRVKETVPCRAEGEECRP